jgi:hypothetical protein
MPKKSKVKLVAVSVVSYLVEFLLDVPDVILLFREVVQVEIVTGS